MSTAITYLIAYITEALIAYYYLCHIFESKRSTKTIFLTYTFVYGVQYFCSFSHIIMLNTLSFIITNFILIYFLYNSSIFLSGFHCLIMTIIMGISELLAANLLGSIYYDYNHADFRYVLFIIYYLISKTLYCILLLFITHVFTKKQSPNISLGKSSILLTIMPILSTVVMLSYYQIAKDISLSNKHELYIIISCICILIINILIIWLFEYTKNKQKMILQLELELQANTDAIQYNKILECQDEEQKILIHDIKRHLQAIMMLSQNENFAQMNEYVENLLAAPSLTQTYKPTHSKHLNLLLSKYITLCKTNNIDFKIDAQNTIIDYMANEDITSLFCNLIDNAMEAATSIPNAIIELKIADKKSASSTIITCVNSCRTAPIQYSDNLFISQKKNPDKHGIGMRSIHKIVEKYNGTMQAYYDDIEKKFHTIIVLQHEH